MFAKSITALSFTTGDIGVFQKWWPSLSKLHLDHTKVHGDIQAFHFNKKLVDLNLANTKVHRSCWGSRENGLRLKLVLMIVDFIWLWDLQMGRVTIDSLAFRFTGLWRHQNLGNCTTVGLHWFEQYQSARRAADLEDALNISQQIPVVWFASQR